MGPEGKGEKGKEYSDLHRLGVYRITSASLRIHGISQRQGAELVRPQQWKFYSCHGH